MRYHLSMRTTLDIDNEVLLAAKELARREHKTAGQMVSELLRKALSSPSQPPSAVKEPEETYGFQPLPRRGGVVTNELIKELREETGD